MCAVNSISPIAGGRSNARPSRTSAGTMANRSSIESTPIAASIACCSSSVLRKKGMGEEELGIGDYSSSKFD